MKIVLLCPASSSEKWVDLAQDLYVTKIQPMMKISVEDIATKKNARESAADKKRVDSEKILSKITPDDYVILFDERGHSQDSRQFAKTVETALNSSRKRLALVVGGAYGVEDSLRKRADKTISFGAMTMNHLLAKVAVLEQTYRAFTILRNLPYHND